MVTEDDKGLSRREDEERSLVREDEEMPLVREEEDGDQSQTKDGETHVDDSCPGVVLN